MSACAIASYSAAHLPSNCIEFLSHILHFGDDARDLRGVPSRSAWKRFVGYIAPAGEGKHSSAGSERSGGQPSPKLEKSEKSPASNGVYEGKGGGGSAKKRRKRKAKKGQPASKESSGQDHLTSAQHILG